jgi:uncharacterized protein YecT (DUF1311 family)
MEIAMIDFTLSPWKELAVLLATSAFGIVGYIAKRTIEKKKNTDALDFKKKALDLHKLLQAEGLTLDDLHQIEQSMTQRKSSKRAIEDNVTTQVTIMSTKTPLPGETQSDMNRLRFADVDIAESLMQKALLEAEMHCNELEACKLRAAQDAWKAYSVAEAEFRSQSFEGGTMYPLMYASELEGMTIARIAELREYVEWVRKL